MGPFLLAIPDLAGQASRIIGIMRMEMPTKSATTCLTRI